MKNLQKLRPNEDLIGFIGRLHFLGVFASFEDTRKYLGLTTRILLPGQITYKDEYKLSKILGIDGRNLSESHSMRNLLNYCVTPQENLGLSIPKLDLKMKVATFCDSKWVVKHPWRWCSHCNFEDSKKFGSGYYHRNHQLPGVFTCYKHCIPLNVGCGDCGSTIDSLKNSHVPPLDNRCVTCGSKKFNQVTFFTPKMKQVQNYMLDMATGIDLSQFDLLAKEVRHYIGIDEDDVIYRTGLMYIREFNRRLLSFFSDDELKQYFTSIDYNNGNRKCRALCNLRVYDSRPNHLPAHPISIALIKVYLDANRHTLPIAA
jgi:hypothetical protein